MMSMINTTRTAHRGYSHRAEENLTSMAKKAVAAPGQNGIKTMAIFSAENPMGQKLNREQNRERTLQLHADLHDNYYHYKNAKGAYMGISEHPVVIVNISMEDVMYFCKKYEQQSFIWGDDDGICIFSRTSKDGEFEYNATSQGLKILDPDDEAFVGKENFTKLGDFIYQYKFEGLDGFVPHIEDETNLIESLDDTKTPRYRYVCRIALNKDYRNAKATF